jgi:hypothetical protein
MLQPMFTGNNNFKGVFSSYNNASDYTGSHSVMNSNSNQTYQSKISDTKENKQSVVEKEKLMKRSSSGRGFKNGA